MKSKAAALIDRPNTGIPLSFLQDDIIICTGEDPHELRRSMNVVLSDEHPRVHQYRCYKAWRYHTFTVVLGGIGTGSLEPLMYELLACTSSADRAPKRLVMIGTAGLLSDSGLGQVYLVSAAYPVGCAVSLPDDAVLSPRFRGIEKVMLP